MSIELHCPQCQKLIRAPEKVGGKRGKCPYCGNSVYIPMAPDPDDEIGLAPIDEVEEQRSEEERLKVSRLASKINHMKDAGMKSDVSAGRPAERAKSDRVADSVDVASEVASYVRAMGESKLDEAEGAARRLKSAGASASDYINAQLVDEMTDIAGDIPAPVVKGFLKTLLGQIG